MCVIFPFFLGIIIPFDYVIFFRGVGQPPTRISWIRGLSSQLKTWDVGDPLIFPELWAWSHNLKFRKFNLSFEELERVGTCSMRRLLGRDSTWTIWRVGMIHPGMIRVARQQIHTDVFSIGFTCHFMIGAIFGAFDVALDDLFLKWWGLSWSRDCNHQGWRFDSSIWECSH